METSDTASVITPDITPDKKEKNLKFAPTGGISASTPQTYFGGDEFARDVQGYKEHTDWKTGFDNMDELQPLYPGLYVLGAISGIGKTTFMLQMADNLAESGKHVLYFCLEQTHSELHSKSLARRIYQNNPNLSDLPTSTELRCGTALDRPEVKEQMEAYPKAVEDRLTIFDCSFGITVENILENVKFYIERVGVRPIVIIDYLQIIAPSGKANSQTSNRDNIDHIVHTLKVMQSEHKLVVIVISSFNRQSYKTQVSLDSFKESGGIEYTADVLWSLQSLSASSDADARRSRNKSTQQSPRSVGLTYLKNRYGNPNSKVTFTYYSAYDFFQPD